MAKCKEFQPISARLTRAILEGAGLKLKNVLGCSLETGAPGETVLNVRVFLDPKAAANVMAAIAAVDVATDEWR